MKPIPPSPKPIKEEKPKFISICNRGECFVESKETKQNCALVVEEEVVSSTEVLRRCSWNMWERVNCFGNIVQLFFMISKIFSCRRRVAQDASF